MTARLGVAAPRALSLWIISQALLFACSTSSPGPTLAPTLSIPSATAAIPSGASPTTAELTPLSPTSTASSQATQSLGVAEPFEIKVAGQTRLVLGQTTLEEALALLPPDLAFGGAPRPSGFSLQVGDYNLAPTTVFNPSAGIYQLHFNEDDVLVLLVDGAVISEQKSLEDLVTEYPGLTLTNDQPNWTEMQVSLAECVTLIAVLNPSQILDSLGYAYVCPTS